MKQIAFKQIQTKRIFDKTIIFCSSFFSFKPPLFFFGFSPPFPLQLRCMTKIAEYIFICAASGVWFNLRMYEQYCRSFTLIYLVSRTLRTLNVCNCALNSRWKIAKQRDSLKETQFYYTVEL